MRILSSSILSLLIHALILGVVYWGPFQSGKSPVDLDEPVYEVELVRPRPAEPEQPVEQEKEQSREEPQKEREQASGREKREEARAAPVPRQEKDRAEKIASKSKKPRQRKEKAERRSAPKEEQTRPKPEPRRAPTGDKVLEEALQDLQKDVDRDRKEQQTLDRELENLRKQTAQRTKGETSSPQREALYASLVEQRVKQNWRFPPVSGDPGLVAEVRVRIKPSGAIADYSLVSGSGRSDFDDSVLRAIEETSKLPEPPQGLETISITFDLREQRS